VPWDSEISKCYYVFIRFIFHFLSVIKAITNRPTSWRLLPSTVEAIWSTCLGSEGSVTLLGRNQINESQKVTSVCRRRRTKVYSTIASEISPKIPKLEYTTNPQILPETNPWEKRYLFLKPVFLSVPVLRRPRREADHSPPLSHTSSCHGIYLISRTTLLLPYRNGTLTTVAAIAQSV
jgi:hypothetical protein